MAAQAGRPSPDYRPHTAAPQRELNGGTLVAGNRTPEDPSSSSIKDHQVDTQVLMPKMYAAFNKRDIDGTLALMSENVSWPKASEGGRVIGKQAIREYWTRQWAEFDPLVYVLEVINRENGVTDVKVRQLVKDLKGNILSDTELWHVYSLKDDLIDRMEIKQGGSTLEGASAAFSGAKHAT
jgi:hypothetical protein